MKNNVAPAITNTTRAPTHSGRNNVAHAENTINVIATPYAMTGPINEV